MINSIVNGNKLLNRINKILELGGKIEYYSVESDSFKYNLEMVDSKMPEYLGNALLYSYQNNCKQFKEVFIAANKFTDRKMAEKKIKRFMEAISSSICSSKKWNGSCSVTQAG